MKGFFLFTVIVIAMAILAHKELFTLLLQQSDSQQADAVSDKPLPDDSADKAAARNDILYSLRMEGAEKANILSDDVTHVAIVTDNTTSMGEENFVKEIAERTFGNGDVALERVFDAIPPSSYTEQKPLKPVVYIYFAKKRGAVQFMISSLNLRKLSGLAENEKNTDGTLFQITSTQWIPQKDSIQLAFFVQPVQQ